MLRWRTATLNNLSVCLLILCGISFLGWVVRRHRPMGSRDRSPASLVKWVSLDSIQTQGLKITCYFKTRCPSPPSEPVFPKLSYIQISAYQSWPWATYYWSYPQSIWLNIGSGDIFISLDCCKGWNELKAAMAGALNCATIDNSSLVVVASYATCTSHLCWELSIEGT